MKEFKLKLSDTVKLSNNLSALIKNTFPGVLKLHSNIHRIKPFIAIANLEYQKVISKYFDKHVPVIVYESTGEVKKGSIDIKFFDTQYHQVNLVSIDKLDKQTAFKKEWSKVGDRVYGIQLDTIDVSLPVFIVQNKIKIILRDYLEQVISPLDLLFYPNELGVIINLFNQPAEN